MSFLLGSDHVHNSGDFHELGLGKLPQDGLQLRALDQTGQLEVILGTMFHVCVRVASIINQVATPDALLDANTLTLIGQLNAHRNVNSRRCEQAWLVLVHFGVKEGKFEQVLGQEEGNCVSLRDFPVAFEEAIRAGLLNLKLQVEQNLLLHVQDLHPRVRIVSEVDEVFDIGWVNLLILGCDEQSGHTDELNVRLQHVKE